MYNGVDKLIFHFLAVAEEGNITKAADILGITQPALTRNIRVLEEQLNIQLFERHASGVKLTAYGQMLARRARLMQLEFEHARAEIAAFQGGRRGNIKIGAIPAWEIIYIPEAVAAAQADIAGINYSVIGDSVQNLYAMLRDGQLDLICTVIESQNHPDIIAEPLKNMERVVVCSDSHPLANRKSVSAEDLLDYSWGHIKDDEITLTRLGGYFSAYDLAPPKIEVECDSNLAMLSILRSSDLLGTAPEPITKRAVFEGLVTLPIQGSLWHYKTGIAYRRESSPPEYLLSFISYLRSFMHNRKELS